MIAFIVQLSAWSVHKNSSSNIAAGVRLASVKTENHSQQSSITTIALKYNQR